MGFLKKLFGGSWTTTDGEQALIVHINLSNLPAEVLEQHDLATIESDLAAAIAASSLGEFDGNEVGEETATIYMYGPDAERLFSGVEKTLRASPLCRGARAIVRSGGPGATQREVIL
jgi:hypothetical protein